MIERVYDEQVRQGWRHQLFRLLRSVFQANPRLSDEGGFLFNWMGEMYLDASLMVVRREMDIQAGTENLRNLLDDMIAHPDVLTRARYVAQWPADEQDIANETFDRFGPVTVTDARERDYIDPASVRTDLVRVADDVERVRTFAERTRAHRTPEQGIDRSLTFRDLHQAIEDIREVVGKYYALLTLRVATEWEPVPQYDTVAPFLSVWVQDAAALRADDDE